MTAALVYTRNARRLDSKKPLPPRPPPPTLQSATFDYYWDRWGTHPGRGLTVQRILQIFQSAEYGYPWAQCDLFDDVIERDAHLRSQVEMRSEVVAGKEWMIQAGGDEPDDIEAARLLADALRMVPCLEETMGHMLSAQPYGWAASEILWDMTPEGVVAPVWFEDVAHRRFLFDDEGCPRLITADHQSDGIELEQGRWLFTRRRHRSIPMSGLMRTAVFPSLFKSLATRDWVLNSERYGLPYPYGTYNDATVEKERDALATAVQNIGKDAYAVFHESCKIGTLDIKGATSPGEVQARLIDWANAEISKLFTGATLTSGEGSSAGSYALGAVHENMLYALALGDALRLGRIFEQQVGIPFVEWNHMDAKPPRLKIEVVKELDPLQRMQVFDAFINKLGGTIDEDQARQEFRIKAPTGKALGGKVAPAPVVGVTPAAPAGPMPEMPAAPQETPAEPGVAE